MLIKPFWILNTLTGSCFGRSTSVRESLRLNDVCCGDVICVLERLDYRTFVLSDERSEANEGFITLWFGKFNALETSNWTTQHLEHEQENGACACG